MVMLTDLLRFRLTDESGRQAAVYDLGLAVLDDDYPPVTEIYFLIDTEMRRIAWGEATRVEPGGRLVVRSLQDAQAADEGPPKGDVLLKRDVLDALIIDLLNRRTTRANDLDLEADDGKLRLRSVDASFSAMLRRISRGWYRHVNQEALYDWQYVEFLRGDPQAVANGAGYRMRIGRLPVGEIAQLADYLPYLHAAELLKLLPDDKAADVLQAMSIDRQVQVIEEMGEDEGTQLLMRMSPDLAADLAGRLPIVMMKRLLAGMPKENSDRIIELLRYPENTVGGVMTNNLICLPGITDAGTARIRLATLLDHTDFAALIFLVENETDRRLRGSVTLRSLLAADDGEKLEDMMDPYIATLNPLDPAVEAAYRIVGSQLPAMPVTEPDGRLIGAVTINAAIALLLPSSSGLRALRVFS